MGREVYFSLPNTKQAAQHTADQSYCFQHIAHLTVTGSLPINSSGIKRQQPASNFNSRKFMNIAIEKRCIICEGECNIINPIKLYGPSGEVNSFAFRDDGANATIIDNCIAKQLGIIGKPSTFDLQWLNSRTPSEETNII